ncbi:MAG: thiol-disulfide isomerase [Acidobacteriota bacterium]|nr:thiol-disulfide isomerase [Acidobacteriota bacterium]
MFFRLFSLGLVVPLVSVVAATAQSGVTFSSDVAPILYQHCVSCHHPNDIAPMSLLTYKEARPWAASIRAAVLMRKMPPWKADPHYGKWSNDPTLTQAEIGTLRSWVDGGAPEGDPKTMPSMPVFSTKWKIGKPDAVITIPVQTLQPSGPDEYSYVTVPTDFTEDKWVVAAELRPSNRKVVHHAHVFVVEPQQKTESKAKTKDPAAEYGNWLLLHKGTLDYMRPDAPVINDGCAVDDNGKFPGIEQNDLTSLLSSYLPGRGPDVYPEGTARRIPAGSKINFQIHYSRTTGKIETDASSVGLIFAPEPPKQIARRIDLSNNMFLIPAGDPNHEVTECHTFTKDIYVTSLTPHMHFRGKSMKFEAFYPDGRTATLLFVPEYSFNWQITYRAAQPIFLPKGTRLNITAYFDNSANNPSNPDPSKVVRFGAASETEMMSGWVEYVDQPPLILKANLQER